MESLPVNCLAVDAELDDRVMIGPWQRYVDAFRVQVLDAFSREICLS
jgi:hypothetical protein